MKTEKLERLGQISLNLFDLISCLFRVPQGKIMSGGKPMAEFNLSNFEKMFHSSDKEVALRTSNDAVFIIPYAGRKAKPDAALQQEISDFNAFAKEHEGFEVYDTSKKPIDSGIRDVLDYMVQLGRSR